MCAHASCRVRHRMSGWSSAAVLPTAGRLKALPQLRDGRALTGLQDESDQRPL